MLIYVFFALHTRIHSLFFCLFFCVVTAFHTIIIRERYILRIIIHGPRVYIIPVMRLFLIPILFYVGLPWS